MNRVQKRNLKLLRAHGEATAESRTPQWSAYSQNLLYNCLSLSLFIREPITQLLIIVIAYQSGITPAVIYHQKKS